jgi:hypothetical protein
MKIKWDEHSYVDCGGVPLRLTRTTMSDVVLNDSRLHTPKRIVQDFEVVRS